MPHTAGWLTVSGAAATNDLVASAVPATAVKLGGAAYAQSGVRFVTTQAVATGDVWLGGVRHRADGAMRIRTTAPSPLYRVNGLGADGTGVVYVSGSLSGGVAANGLNFNQDGSLYNVETAV